MTFPVANKGTKKFIQHKTHSNNLDSDTGPAMTLVKSQLKSNGALNQFWQELFLHFPYSNWGSPKINNDNNTHQLIVIFNKSKQHNAIAFHLNPTPNLKEQPQLFLYLHGLNVGFDQVQIKRMHP